jgi:hypothetical protein
MAGLYDNPICRTGPPGYVSWQNRFLGFINVYKYGLRGRQSRAAEREDQERERLLSTITVQLRGERGGQLETAKPCILMYIF